MCEELEISRDAYYKWLKRKGTKNIYEINQEMAIKQEHEISEYLEHMAYFLKNVQ